MMENRTVNPIYGSTKVLLIPESNRSEIRLLKTDTDLYHYKVMLKFGSQCAQNQNNKVEAIVTVTCTQKGKPIALPPSY